MKRKKYLRSLKYVISVKSCSRLFLLLCISSAVATSSTLADRVSIHLSISTNELTGRREISGRFRDEKDNVPAWILSPKAVLFEDVIPELPPFIMDQERTGSENEYDRLWLDFSGNGVIESNEFVELESKWQGRLLEAAPFRCIVNDGGHSHSIPFSARVYEWGHGPQLRISSYLQFEGDVTLNNQPFHISLRDSDGNGCVHEFLASRNDECGSHLRFNPASNMETRLYIPLARTLGIADGFYQLDLALKGPVDVPYAVLTFDSFSPQETGAIEIDGEGVTSVEFSGEGAALLLYPKNKRLTVPAGSWRVEEVTVREAESTYVAHPVEEDGLTITVKTEEVFPLRIGGPLVHSVRINGAWGTGRVSASLGQSTGIGGLSYNGAGADAPGWVVRRPGGKRVASGNFEYG